MEDSSLDLMVSPLEFFWEKVSSAMGNQKLQFDQEVEYYLVNLLVDFISPEKMNQSLDIDFLDTPLALMLKKALEAPVDQQIKIYKILGDTSLYVSGYFQDYFNRKTYDVDYYMAIGASAYSSLSSLVKTQNLRQNHIPGVYRSLSTSFPQLVEVVAEVADLLGHSGNENLLAVYDRWTKNQSDRLRKKLEDSGINPILNINSKVEQ